MFRVIGIKFLDVFLDILEKNVKTVFSYPGEQILPLYNEIDCSSIKNIMVRDERGAGFMADGYARITNYVGVCLVTAGPGSTNLTTPIATAYKDNSSILAITGRCSRRYINRNYFQEISMKFLDFYKGHYVDKPDISYLIEAFKDSLFKKKPVQLNIPVDVYGEDAKDINTEIYLNIYKRNNIRDDNNINRDSDKLNILIDEINNIKSKYKNPIFLIGQGIFGTLTYEEITKISKILKDVGDVPISTTFPARGVIDENDEICVGLVGRRGGLEPLLNADKIINIGASLSYNTYVESVRDDLLRKTININLNPRNLKELKEFFENITLKTDNINIMNNTKDNKSIRNNIGLKSSPKFQPSGDYSKKINEVIKNIPEDAIIVTDAGKHTVFTCLLKTCIVPRNIISSHSFGTMGFGLPTSIGVKFGTIDFNIDREVVLISGDGGFMMNLEELNVISEYNLKILMIVMKNNSLADFCNIKNPNINKIADAFGIDNCYIEDIEDIDSEIKIYLKGKKPLLMVIETENEPLPKPNI